MARTSRQAMEHAYYIVHVDAEDKVLGTFPFGTKLHEFTLHTGESVLVRDETGTDILVVATA